uniref:Golgin B1 n=1 Tax=Esox lucius TaxID=8010 RepID=A0A6Q2ZJS1_ESOLU
MLKWFSNEEGSAGQGVSMKTISVAELLERLAQTEQLVTQLKELIREKDGVLCTKDEQLKELMERAQRLQVERESLGSKMEAEKHVMRAQLRDLLEKHQGELRSAAESHEARLAEHEQALRGQLEQELGRSLAPQTQMQTGTTQAKLKSEEASKSEAKFLKIKAWSKSRIRQLEDELRKSQSGHAGPDVTSLRSRITDLEEEREEVLWKLEQYEELKAKNGEARHQLGFFEQQRKMAADLEQVTKRAASQASESGSADDTQSQVLEWQEMVSEAVTARDRAREEKATMALRMSHMEEEREGKGPAIAAGSESTTPMEEEGENMGGWWPEYTSPDTGGLRSVVEELELERNQLQEQILGLEERCQDLEDRLQLQARIESLQSESERLQGQLSSLRNQQSRDAEKHQLLVTSLNEQLKGLSDTQECLETSLIEKENTLVKTSEKLELIDSLRDSLQEREAQQKEVSDNKTCFLINQIFSFSLRKFPQNAKSLKNSTQKQEAMIETLQTDLDQTNDELDKLNTTHLEERAQLIHDLQSCEREIDNLRDTVLDKDKEILALSGNMAEYAEQIMALKQEIKHKEEELVRLETSLTKSEREAQIIRDSQSSDQQALNIKTAELMEQLKYAQTELCMAKEEKEAKMVEVEDLSKQVDADKRTILELRGEIQKQNIDYGNHLKECETQISSLKEQVTTELKSVKEERNKLLEEVDRHNSELKTLSTRLENQVECQEKLKQEVHEKQKKIYFLEEQLRTTQEEAEAEQRKFYMDLQARDSEKKILAKDLQGESENITKMQNLLKNMNIEKQQLQDDIEKKAEELKSQKQLVEELNEKCTAALELNSSLSSQANSFTEENQRMQQDVAVKDKLLLEMTNDRDSLMNKISFFETQHSDNSKVIEGLLKDKEELTVRVNELNNSLEKNKLSISESLEKEVAVASDLDRRVNVTLEENTNLSSLLNSLTEEKNKLQQELNIQSESVSELTKEKNSLQDKLSNFEMKHSENCKMIDGLLKDKKELSVTVDELKTVLVQNTQSISESVLQKTNECSDLTKLLRGSEEALTCSQQQVESLNIQLNQLNGNMSEKENTIKIQNSQIEAQQSELLNLQETLALLQEQVTTLKSGLTEKDMILQQKVEECSSLQIELRQQKTLLSKLRDENESLLGQCSQLTQRLGEKEENLTKMAQELENHKDELDKKNESLKSLGSQLDVVNETHAMLESENTELKTSLETLAADNNKLRQEMDQRHSEVRDLKDNIQALNEQNVRLKSEFRNSVTEASKQLEEISTLKAGILNRDSDVSDLKEQLSTACSEKESLVLSLQQRDKSLKQQEEFIKQLEAQSVEGKGQMSHAITELQTHVQSLQQSLQDKDVSLHESAKQLNLLRDKLTLESEGFKTQLSSNAEAMAELQRDLYNSVEKRNQLNVRMEEQEAVLKQKVDDYVSLRKYVSEMEDSLMQLRSQVSSLTSESSLLKETLKEKDSVFMEAQRSSSAISENLHFQLQAKDTECESLKEQVSHLKESKLIIERDECVRSYSSQIQTMQVQLQLQRQQQSSNTNEAIEKMVSEKERLQLEVTQLQAERTQLQGHLQRCLYEIQQRDLHCQQLDAKLQQVVEEKVGVSTQLRAVSQTLRDTQNRCYWLENQASPHQHNQGLGQNVVQLMESLAEERARREAAEEALGLAEERANSPSKSTQRDFSIQLEAEDEWEALILNPNEPLVTRKVKGGVLACRRWLRGRSLYCSKLLTSRTRSRYLFLGYLLLLHVAVLMCLTGAL